VEAATPEHFELRLLGCLPPKSCTVISKLAQLPATYAGLRGVAATGDDEAWVAGHERAEDDDSTLIARFFGDALEVLPALPGIAGEASNIDRGADELVGTTLDGWVFRLDGRGTPLSTSSVAFDVRDADTGPDGTTALVSDDGDVAVLPAGSTVAESLPRIEPIGAEPRSHPEIAVWRRDRMVVAGPDLRVRLFDGRSWRVIVDDERIRTEAVAVDASRVFVLPSRLPAMVLDEESGVWTSFEEDPAFFFANAITAAALGDGRFFVVGQSGHAAYFNGERLCALGRAAESNLADLSVSPSGRVVYAVGGNDGPGTPPAIVRYELPPD
jgi:hypothetical protein